MDSEPASAGMPQEKHDASLIVSVDSAIRRHRNGRIFLVDVRNRMAFETIRIPGSLNIPLYTVKTRSFLKTRSIVMVNEGFASALLAQECRRLNQMGFKAYLLHGGLNNWSYRKGPLEGDLFNVKTFSTVSSQLFHQEKEYKDILLIDVSPARSKTSKQIIPEAVHLTDTRAFVKQSAKDLSPRDLRTLVKRTNKNPNSTILITNQDGKGYEHITKMLAKTGTGPAFYLQGGLTGYRRYLENLAFSRLPKNTRIKTVNRCDTCGEGNGSEKIE